MSTCATCRLTELRHAVAIVFEDTFLFNDSVYGNIAFARPDADTSRRRAGRSPGRRPRLRDASARGLRHVIGERGFSLSGGQRQRIAIARAILADPRVLVLDDATSAVDPSKEHEIRDAMATVMEGRTTIVIAHRPGTIALADKVVLVDDGRVAASGTHDHLLATNERYREVLAALRRGRRTAELTHERESPRTTVDVTRWSADMWGGGAVSDEDRLDRSETDRVLRRSVEFAEPYAGGSTLRLGLRHGVHDLHRRPARCWSSSRIDQGLERRNASALNTADRRLPRRDRS